VVAVNDPFIPLDYMSYMFRYFWVLNLHIVTIFKTVLKISNCCFLNLFQNKTFYKFRNWDGAR
jgi:hypothetical protein